MKLWSPQRPRPDKPRSLNYRINGRRPAALGIIASMLPAAAVSPSISPTPSSSTRCDWRQSADGWTLTLAGDGRGGIGARLALAPAAITGGTVTVDARALSHWDPAFAAALWQPLAALQGRGVQLALGSLPEGLRDVLELALAPPARVELQPVGKVVGNVTGTGLRSKPKVTRTVIRRANPAPSNEAPTLRERLYAAGAEALTTAAFLGEVLLALGRLARGRTDMRRSDLWRQLDLAGPLSVPIVGLTCILVGLMTAYMGGAQLDRIGAQSFIADVVTVGMVREMAGLMTGVILSGRLGAAYAAQLASMQANEEIDALRALGVDPISYLVLPRLLGLLLVAPLLIGTAAVLGVLAGLPAAVGVYGVPAAEYLHNCLKALTWTHLWIGLFKGTIYVALVALAGCREGLHAGRNAQAVGVATTAAVVKALVWIVAAACGTTVLFQSLGL